MVFCNVFFPRLSLRRRRVTILILVDGFLQLLSEENLIHMLESYNPYFSRWFSAMRIGKIKNYYGGVTILILVDGFLQSDNAVFKNMYLTQSQSLF